MKRREALKKMSLTMGGILSATTIAAVLSHCTGKNDRDHSLGTVKSILDGNEMKIISQISDRIIPATDTPGAIDAKVPEWIELMLNDCYDQLNQNKFKQGLEKFSAIYSAQFDEDISDSNSDELERFLTEYEQRVYREGGRNDEEFFIKTVKELTLLGYFTSETGATQALKYNPVPAKYEACKPMEDEKSWATN